MSWIKENKFIAGLTMGTLLGVIVLFFVGSLGSDKYEAAKEKFDTASSEAAGYEKGPLYPKPENKSGKSKALGEYRQSVESLQAVFEPFRPKEIKNISPQEFTDRLLAANTEVRKAFTDAGTVVPDAFFVGFERYTTSMAPSSTTGILEYQLNSIKSLMLAMSKAKIGELKNLYRPTNPEEDGQIYIPSDTSVARSFPLELTFTGTEKSVREFLSSITKPQDQYVVIRSFRLGNMKKDPPQTKDAHFDNADSSSKPATSGDVFSGGFVLPGDPAPASSEKAAQAPAPSKPADSSRILSQVLGMEQIQVFLRLDLLEFLPAKKLP
jgi:hypothetical protein